MAQMNEELLETKYSGNVFARLFAYVKPHIKTMILALVLVLIVTGIDLVKPVLIGNAIDDYIEGYDKPYVQAAPGEAQITIGSLPLKPAGTERAEGALYARLIYVEEDYYLVRDLEAADLEAAPVDSSATVRSLARHVSTRMTTTCPFESGPVSAFFSPSVSFSGCGRFFYQKTDENAEKSLKTVQM